MTKGYKTYDDLMYEIKQREMLLQAQKEVIMEDFEDATEKLKPVATALTMAGKMVTRDNTSIAANIAIEKVVNVLVRDLVLARAGWFAKLAIPYALKNYASHYFADHKEEFKEKLTELVGFKNGKQKKDAESFQHA